MRTSAGDESSEVVEDDVAFAEDFAGPAPSLAPSPSSSDSSLHSYTLPKSTSPSFVSYADGLDTPVDLLRPRNPLQSSTHDTSDISQKLQLAVTTIQTELLVLEGDVNKLVADDKGLLAIAVFGLPPMYVPLDLPKKKRSKKNVGNYLSIYLF